MFRFRSIDINNGGLCVFNFNVRGEAMLKGLNMTAHMYSDHVYPGQFNLHAKTTLAIFIGNWNVPWNNNSEDLMWNFQF